MLFRVILAQFLCRCISRIMPYYSILFKSCSGFAYLNMKIFETNHILISQHCIKSCSKRNICTHSMPNRICKCHPIEFSDEFLISLHREFWKPKILCYRSIVSVLVLVWVSLLCSAQYLTAVLLYFIIIILLRLFQGRKLLFWQIFSDCYYVSGSVLGFQYYCSWKKR